MILKTLLTFILTYWIDGSKVEAQTPDGTRVATPNPHASAGIPRQAQSRTSYAAALKAEPADWHLEFFMDDSPLPLDLTIYGAIHQHEMRKRSGPVALNLIWQGVLHCQVQASTESTTIILYVSTIYVST